MFRLADTPIDIASCRAALANLEAGGYVSFEGWVRRHNEGREVTALAYEAYPAMANHQAERLLAEARTRFAIESAHVVHRVGQLGLGDIAVWIGVTARHRGPAFAACQFLIDGVKERLPIWKRETYVDGTSDWVNCACVHAKG